MAHPDLPDVYLRKICIFKQPLIIKVIPSLTMQTICCEAEYDNEKIKY